MAWEYTVCNLFNPKRIAARRWAAATWCGYSKWSFKYFGGGNVIIGLGIASKDTLSHANSQLWGNNIGSVDLMPRLVTNLSTYLVYLDGNWEPCQLGLNRILEDAPKRINDGSLDRDDEIDGADAAGIVAMVGWPE